MTDKEKVIDAFERCFCEKHEHCPGCYQNGPGFGVACRDALCMDVLALLKEQDSVEYALDVLRRNGWKDDSYGDLLKEQESIKPTINEYGEAYCVCGENVGIIPSSNSLPKIRSKYCSECGRRMKWNE